MVRTSTTCRMDARDEAHDEAISACVKGRVATRIATWEKWVVGECELKPGEVPRKCGATQPLDIRNHVRSTQTRRSEARANELDVLCFQRQKQDHEHASESANSLNRGSVRKSVPTHA